jgi:hypothetical protein
MTSNPQNISNYNFKSTDRLLLDTNVWLFSYGPQTPTDPRVITYTGALKKILAAKCLIFIDVLITSEFINTYARIQYGLTDKKTNFKVFRKSLLFKKIAKDIADDLRRLLKNCSKIENGFQQLALDDLLDEYQLGDSDFNDQIFVSLCKRENLILVTDDADFKGQGIPILTANGKLLFP